MRAAYWLRLKSPVRALLLLAMKTLLTLETALQALIGEQLSSVTFVMDYWQLAFDGYGLTVYSRTTVSGPDWQMSDGDDQFRNRLCERIAHLVTGASFREGEGLSIAFDDGTTIEVSVKDNDYDGPEAFTFSVPNSDFLIVV